MAKQIIKRRGNGDWNVKYRPYKFNEMIGQGIISMMLGSFLCRDNLPHALLFTGQSGCGKTTAARIISLALNCEKRSEYMIKSPKNIDECGKSVLEFMENVPCCECNSCKSTINLNSFAVQELDAARTSDVATVRDVLGNLPSAPMSGEPFKVLILDEAHNLSGKAEDALLKFLEDAPEHVYIILCTNESQKLKAVTKNRCKVTQFGRLENSDVYKLIYQVCEFEGLGLAYKPDILNYITTESNGVPRQALSYLQQIGAEGSWTKDSASLIINAGADIDSAEVFGLCKVILNNSFRDVLKYYAKVKNIPVETIRIITTGFFTGRLKNARTLHDAAKYSKIIDVISVHYYGPKPENILINSFFKITQILRGN